MPMGHLYFHDTWGKILILHQGTQALIAIRGALLFFLPLVPLGSSTVQSKKKFIAHPLLNNNKTKSQRI